MAALESYREHPGIAAVLVEIARQLADAVALVVTVSGAPQSGHEVLAAEMRHRENTARIADLLIMKGIVMAHQVRDFVAGAVRASAERLREGGARRVKHVGWRRVHLLLPGGLRTMVPTPYIRPTRKGLVGRPRSTGKRREGGAGRYPVLDQLGITSGVTPLTRSDICRQVVLCSSYTEAQEQLARSGLEVDRDTLVRVAVGTGVDALAQRNLALHQAREEPVPDESMVMGKRIRVSIDGGRARTRQTKSHSRKGKNGRRPFTLQWREPRIITIDVLDDEGDVDRKWRPIYEVSLGTADEVFALLTGLLRMLGAKHAAEIVFVSDGAEWIWNRVEQLVKDAELPADRVHKLLDFYHATEHITEALKACKAIGVKARAALFEKLRRLLLEPTGPQQVIDELRGLARGRRGKRVNKEVNYLESHLAHMPYAQMRAQKVPIGSGVVESAVRRVLNLRFKSASMCWRVDNLEPLLYLRAILKAGRWDDFMAAHLAGHHWIRSLPPSTDAVHASPAVPLQVAA